MVNRLARFIEECGLLRFTFRSDREPAILAMMEEACTLSGRKGSKDLAGTDVPKLALSDEMSDSKLSPQKTQSAQNSHCYC